MDIDMGKIFSHRPPHTYTYVASQDKENYKGLMFVVYSSVHIVFPCPFLFSMNG